MEAKPEIKTEKVADENVDQAENLSGSWFGISINYMTVPAATGHAGGGDHCVTLIVLNLILLIISYFYFISL